MLQKLGLFSKKLFLKSPWAGMQKYFKTNASASWELSNTKTLKALSGSLVFGNHDKTSFSVFAVLL